jgi:hypothetical protein
MYYTGYMPTTHTVLSHYREYPGGRRVPVPARLKAQEGPSLRDKARNLRRAATASVEALLTGKPTLVTADIATARKLICRACEFWSTDGYEHCGHKACGCTNLKNWLTTKRCPVGKW